LLKRKSNPEFSRYHNNSRGKLQNQKAQVLQRPIPTASFVNSEAQRHQLPPFWQPRREKKRAKRGHQLTAERKRRRATNPSPRPPPSPRTMAFPTGTYRTVPPLLPPSPAPWFLGSRLLAVGTAPSCVVSRAYRSRLAVGTVPDLGRGSAPHQTAHTFTGFGGVYVCLQRGLAAAAAPYFS
jgi:hypothetical protein